MRLSLFTWLDSSPTHYAGVAWSVFAAVGLAALVPLAPRLPKILRHAALFGGLLLLCLLAFRWPALLDNRQFFDPDESQLMSGALVLRQDPHFWRSVDGTTHGPLAEWAILLPSLFTGQIDYTLARTVGVALVWLSLLAAWSVFRRFFPKYQARLLLLPLLATHALTNFAGFVQYGSELVPAALIAIGCAFLLTALPVADGEINRRSLFLAGVMFGAAPFAKIQVAPLAAWGLAGGAVVLVAPGVKTWRERRAKIWPLVLGGLTVPVALFFWVCVDGLLPDFWRSYILNNAQYAGARWFDWSNGPMKYLELARGAGGTDRYLVWMGTLALVGLLWWRSYSEVHRRTLLFAVGMVAAALYAVMAPGKLFAHYLQLLLFPVGLLAGLVTGRCSNALKEKLSDHVAGGWAVAGVMAVFLICSLGPQVKYRLQTDSWPLGAFTRTGGKLESTGVGREIAKYARPGQRVAIWGWEPKFWIETGTLQATRDGNSWRQIEPFQDRQYYRARYLSDLKRSDPGVFIDAVGSGNFSYTNRDLAGHETFRSLRKHIAAYYRAVGDFSGTRIYVRNEMPFRKPANRTDTGSRKTPGKAPGQVGGEGSTITLTIAPAANSPDTLNYLWQFNGRELPGASEPKLTITNFQPTDTGIYSVVSAAAGAVRIDSFVAGLLTSAKVVGAASEVGPNSLHANGNVYDQVLLTGAAATVTADRRQGTHIAFIDDNDDLVQVELTGAGALSLVLANATGPVAPTRYHDTARYMKGHAGIVIAGADESTHLTISSVGRLTTTNPNCLREGITYDGYADLGFIAILSRNGYFGGVRTGNARFSADHGFAGIYAPGVDFLGPVLVADIAASGSAAAVLMLGSGSDVRIAGGTLRQPNEKAVRVSGIEELRFVPGCDSNGSLLPARIIQARLEEDRRDVTELLVADPEP